MAVFPQYNGGQSAPVSRPGRPVLTPTQQPQFDLGIAMGAIRSSQAAIQQFGQSQKVGTFNPNYGQNEILSKGDAEAASALVNQGIAQAVGQLAIATQRTKDFRDIADAEEQIAAFQSDFDLYKIENRSNPEAWGEEFEKRFSNFSGTVLENSGYTPATRSKINRALGLFQRTQGSEIIRSATITSIKLAQEAGVARGMRHNGNHNYEAEMANVDAMESEGLMHADDAERNRQRIKADQLRYELSIYSNGTKQLMALNDFEGARNLLNDTPLRPDEKSLQLGTINRAELEFEASQNPQDFINRFSDTSKQKTGQVGSIRGTFQISAEELSGNLGGGLKAYAQDFIDAGKEHNLDPRFLAAVSKLETANGTSNAFRNKNNAMGISDGDGPINVSSVRDSIFRQAESLSREGGYYDGADTIEDIGAIYAPPGAGNDPNATNGYWPAGVRKFYEEMVGESGLPEGVSPAFVGKLKGAASVAIDKAHTENLEMAAEVVGSGLATTADIQNEFGEEAFSSVEWKALQEKEAGTLRAEFGAREHLENQIDAYDPESDTDGSQYRRISRLIALHGTVEEGETLTARLDQHIENLVNGSPDEPTEAVKQYFATRTGEMLDNGVLGNFRRSTSDLQVNEGDIKLVVPGEKWWQSATFENLGFQISEEDRNAILNKEAPDFIVDQTARSQALRNQAELRRKFELEFEAGNLTTPQQVDEFIRRETGEVRRKKFETLTSEPTQLRPPSNPSEAFNEILNSLE